MQKRLDAIGNIRSDGRPILGLDAKELLAIALELSLGQLGSFAVDYASETVVEVHGDRTILRSLNFVPWRDIK